MVAVVTGSDLGLSGSSLSVLGAAGQSGTATTGRGGEAAYVDAVSGNLVIQRQDEILVGVGQDLGIVRTYNSQAQLADDNGDNWRLGLSRSVGQLTGSLNSAGSTVTRVGEDGSETVFTYDATQGAYVASAGGGAFDTLRYHSADQQWIWTDGDTQVTETYDAAHAGRLIAITDADGNRVMVGYNAAGLVDRITDANGEQVVIDYATTPGQTANITQIRTLDATGTTTATRVRYGYDGSNRLTSVTVDLSPEDSSIADGKTYVTRYTYEGSSRRIASVTQTDGSVLSFTYESGADGQYRIKTYTDAAGRVTTVTYDSGSQIVSVTAKADSALLSTSITVPTPPYYTVATGDTWASITQAVYGTSHGSAIAALQAALGNPTLTAGARLSMPMDLTYSVSSAASANGAALSSTTTEAADYVLNSSVLTTPTPGWGTAAVLSGSGTTSATNPQVAYDQNGNGLAIWVQGTDLVYSVYSKASDSWTNPSMLDGSLTGAPSTPHLSMSANGNALVTWVQNGNIYARRCIGGTWDGADTIPLLENSTALASSPIGSINDSGRAIVVFLQSGNLFANIYSSTTSSWPTTAINLDDKTTANANAITAIPKVAIDASGNATVLWLQLASSANTYVDLYSTRYTASTNTWSATSNTVFESSTTGVVAPQIAFDGNGNGLAVWVQGTTLYARRYTASTNIWAAATALSTSASGTPSLSISSNGNALVTWLQSGSVYARRFSSGTWLGTGAQLIETVSGTAYNPVGRINNAGEAAVAFVQAKGPPNDPANDLFVAQFDGFAWSGTATPIDSNANSIATSAVPSVALDAFGNTTVLWLQKNGAQTTDSVYVNRYAVANGKAYYYTIPAGATWNSVATTLYGSATVAAALQAALGNPPLTAGTALTNLPATLTGTVTITVPPYYAVQNGDTWEGICQAIYGSNDASAVSALRGALGNPALTAGTRLTVPPALEYPVALHAPANTTLLANTIVESVAPYYTVVAGDDWAAIATKVYGTALAADALQSALGSPTLTVGTHLNVPLAFSYDTPRIAVGNPTLSGSTGHATTLTDALGQETTLIYDAAGQLLSVTAPAVDGVSQQAGFSYDAAGNVVSATDERGNTTAYGYDAHGNRISERDALGNTVTRLYSAANQLLNEVRYTVPDPDGAGPALPGGALVGRYVYDAENHLRFAVSAEGRVTEYRYNAAGQRIAALQYTSHLYPVTGLTADQPLSEADLAAWLAGTDPAQAVRTDTGYDFRGQVSMVTTYAALDASGNGIADGSQATVQYVYDPNGKLLQIIDPRGVATSGIDTDFVTTYTYDGLNRLTGQIDAQGNLTAYTYTDSDRLTAVRLANGLVTTTTEDLNGHVIRVVQSDGTASLSTTQYSYDALGRLRMQTDSLGQRTFYLYDAAGRQVGTIDPTGALIETVFNADNQAVCTIRYAKAVSGAVLTTAAANPAVLTLSAARPATDAAHDVITRWLYDAAGRLTKTLDGVGAVTEYQYDGAGRLIGTVRYANTLSAAQLSALASTGGDVLPSDANATPLADPANDRLERRFYDADGWLRGILDSEGYLTEFRYDDAGRLQQTVHYGTATAVSDRITGTLATLRSSANALPASNITSAVWYNGLGQKVGELDGEGYYTAYQYDLAGNRTRATRYANRLTGTPSADTVPKPVASAQDQTTLATWTVLNQLDTETTADGTQTHYSYDRVGNLVSTVVASGAADSRTFTYRYDRQGRLIGELSPLGAQALAALGTHPSAAEVDAVWAAYGTAYTYDAAGRRTQRTDANGNVTLYFYDADNRLTFTVTRVKNPADPAQWVGEVSAREFNSLGQLTAEVGYATRLTAAAYASLTGGADTQIKAVLVVDAAHDRRSDYSYLLSGQLARSTDQLSAGEVSITERRYNAFGELTILERSLDALRTRRDSFSYDRRGLVIQAVQDVAWAANPNGTGRVTNTAYDAFGRIVRTTDGNGVTRALDYDKLGRQVQTVSAVGSLNRTCSATYDAFGRVLTQTDAQGHTTAFTYGSDPSSGRTTLTVTSPEGIVTQTVTDRYGQTVTLVDGLGNETRTTYDANGDLLTLTRWDKAANAETLIETGSYDAVGNRLSVTDANGNQVTYTYDAAGRVLTRTVDPDGLCLVTRYAYDPQGRQVSVTDANGTVTQTTYDAGGRAVLVAVDPNGLNLRTQYSYDLAGHLVTVVEGEGTAEARTTTYNYDGLGRRIQTVVDPMGLHLVTTYAYDGNDNLVSKVEAAGTDLARTTRYSYDDANRLVYTIDALGGVVKHDYDANGRVLQSTAYAHPIGLASLSNTPSLAAISAVITADAGLDRITRHVYDAAGRERFTIDATGAVAETQYDAAGNVTKRIRYASALQGTLPLGSAPQIVATPPGSGAYVLASANDPVTTFVYDAFNRLIARTEAAGTALARTESWGYDGTGNLLRHTDARGHMEWFAYDGAGRQIRHIDQGGYVTDTVWNADGSRQSETRYANAVALPGTADDRWAVAGHAGNPVANTDPVSGDRTTTYTYDRAGRTLIRTDAQGGVTRYRYDELGQCIDTTVADGTAQAVTLRRYYDTLGRVITEIRAYGSADANATIYNYDLLGNQTSIVEAADTEAARITRQEFDRLGRKTAAIDASNGRIVTTYNTFGEVVKVTDALGNAGYFYTDAQGRVTLQIDPEGAVTETRYDVLGNVTDIIKYASKVVGTPTEASRPPIQTAAGTGTYVLRNEAADQHQQAIYDALGQKTEIRTWWGANASDYYRETFSYDAAGNVLAATARNGATTTYSYDALNRKVREVLPVTSKLGGTAVAVENRFAYNAFGDLTQKTEAYGLPEQRITRYVFDTLGRQVKEIGEAITTFDPVTRTEVVVTPTKQRLFDARGNLIEDVDARGSRTLHYYDALDRETGRVDAAGTYMAWTYDALGNRTSQTIYANAVQVVGGGALSPLGPPEVMASVPASGAYVLTNALEDRSVSYTYDLTGRLTGTCISGVTIGAYNASMGAGQYEISTGSLVTTTIYDAQGNAIKTIDANGNTTRAYFNKVGQKIGQLDAKGYLTVWTRDAVGNVTQEYRYASALNGQAVADSTSLSALISAITASADDRITLYTYDGLNRVVTEIRKNVASGTVNASNGMLNETLADSVTAYVYDGLNHVTQKTDALGAVTNWTYDGLGRQTREQRPGYTDYQGASVRPTTDTEYDGLGHVTRKILRGTNTTTEADDRITTYTYGTGGFLSGQTDANGAVTQYRIDANGNVTQKTLKDRKNADGVGTNDITEFQYDGLNRQVKSTDRGTGTTQEVRYNGFGEVTGKRTSGGGAEVAWPEFAYYDQAGRIWKTNSGDGVTKVYVFDANGNATLSIQSAGTDLAGLSLAGVLQLSDTLKTVSVFDARNQLTDSFQPTMEAVRQLVAIAANTTGQAVFVANNTAIAIGPQAAIGSMGTTNPITAGASGFSPASSVSAMISRNTVKSGILGTAIYSLDFYLSLSGLGGLGAGNFLIRIGATATPLTPTDGQTWKEYTVSGNTSSYHFYQEFNGPGGDDSGALSLQIYKKTPSGNVLILDSPNALRHWSCGTEANRGYGYSYSCGTTKPALLQFKGQPNTAKSLLLAYRAKGSTGAYTLLSIPAVTMSGSVVPGSFETAWSSLSGGNWEYRYWAFDASGAIVNKQSGNLDLTKPATPAVVQNNGALGGIGGDGWGFFDASGKLYLTELGNTATSVVVKYRLKGTSTWTPLATTKDTSRVGWFSVSASAFSNLMAAGQTYELDIASYSGDALVMHSATEASKSAQGVLSITPFASYIQQASIIQFSERTDTDHVDVSYRLVGSTDAYTTLSLTPTPVGSGSFRWDASALVPVNTANYDYEVVIKAYSDDGLLNNQTAATLRLGANAAVLSSENQTAPLTLRLTPPQANVASLTLGYRVLGSTEAYTPVPTTLVGTEFRADLRNVTLPASGSVIYEYVYDAYAASGTLLGRDNGNFTLQAAGTSANRLDWVIQGVSATSHRIHRSQVTNAFGEVVTETDGLGRVTNLAYNTLGKLVQKQAPETNVTLANGFIQRAAPTTRYIYDLGGRLVATVDPNGNTTTQVWQAGAQEDEIVMERHADGGVVKHAYDIFGDKRVDTDALGYRTEMAYDKLGHVVEVKHPMRADGNQAIDRYAYDAAGNRISHTNALDAVEKTDYDSLGRVTRTRDYMGFATRYTYVYSNAILGVAGLKVGGWQKTTTDAVGRTQIDRQDIFGRASWHQDLGGHQFSYTYNGAGWLVKQTGTTGQNIVTDYYANGYVKSILDKATGAYTAYEYDAEGNRTFEGYVILKNPADLNGGVRDFYQYANLEYDELNRLKRVVDPKAEITYEYDAAGNRRHMVSSYQDGVTGARQTQDYWYAYDAMNRFTVTMGQLSSGARGTSATDNSVAIVRGTTGVGIAYDLAGQRRQAVNGSDGTVENYSYSADGYLEDVTIGGVLRSRRTEDLLGRVVSYSEWDATGHQTYNRNTAYDQNGRVLSQNGTDGSTTNYYYTDASDNAATASQDGAGELARQVGVNGQTTVTSYFAYEYWDSAKEKAVTAQAYDPQLEGNNAYWQPGYAKHVYDVNGHLAQAIDAGFDGAVGTADDRQFRYVTDAQGVILLRDELAAGQVNRIQHYYYANGVRVGDVGNDGPSRTDYVQAIAARGVNRANYKDWTPIASADFDQNYEPVGPNYPGMAPSSYTVRASDTLQSIARSTWGDSSLWYFIADANGLSGTEDLVEGQRLTLPNKITNIHNNAGTFRPYNPGEAIGDTSPTIPTPPPPPRHDDDDCGGASIIIAIVVIVVTIYTAGATAEMGAAVEGGGAAAGGGAAGGSAAVGSTTAGFGATMEAGVSALAGGSVSGMLVGGAAGSIAGQLTGMALGVQDKFSWGAVATAALSTLAGGAAGAYAGGSIAGAMAANVATQGVNILAGQQRSFSWASLAASAISSPVTKEISGDLMSPGGIFNAAANSPAMSALVRGTTGALVSATVRMALEGGKLRWEAVAADALTSAIQDAYTPRTTVGNAMGNSLASAGTPGSVSDNDLNAILGGTRDLLSGERYVLADAGGTQSDVARGLIQTGDRLVIGNGNVADDDEVERIVRGKEAAYLENKSDPLGRSDGIYQGNDVWSYPVSLNSGIEERALPPLVESNGSIQADPGLLSNLGGIAGAYFDGRIGFRDAIGMANGQIGGIGNVARDTVTGTLNGLIAIPEIALNAFGQATLPGDPGYVSFPKFAATGRTGSLQDDIGMMAPVLLGVRGSSTSSSLVDSEVGALERIAANNRIDTGSAVRMARIDELATANYNRILMRDLGNSNYVYRAVNADMIDIYEAQGAITGRAGSPTYFSLDVGATPGEHMLGAQMPTSPQVMLKIPTNSIVDPIVPRPDWGTSSIGREYFTNSYPKWGPGGYRQFVGTTNGFSRDWIMPGWGTK